MRTRVLLRPIVFLRIRFSICVPCSILILLIKILRYSVVRCCIHSLQHFRCCIPHCIFTNLSEESATAILKDTGQYSLGGGTKLVRKVGGTHIPVYTASHSGRPDYSVSTALRTSEFTDSFWRFRTFAGSDCQPRHIRPSVRPHGTRRLLLNGFFMNFDLMFF